MLGLVNLYLAHMRQVYHQLQERMIKVRRPYRAMCQSERRASISEERTSGIIVNRGIKHSESLVVAVDCKSQDWNAPKCRYPLSRRSTVRIRFFYRRASSSISIGVRLRMYSLNMADSFRAALYTPLSGVKASIHERCAVIIGRSSSLADSAAAMRGTAVLISNVRGAIMRNMLSLSNVMRSNPSCREAANRSSLWQRVGEALVA